ncbi:hypothetical protein BKA65DRAFT_545777 [Rhexocercosporidium sp. MPI-PUGE-AT-0058]|nr:hypothetical protein BKA65DRAFT_545777 [Rhexocercosporidium sp. MPI-PUGE-AT-0058]
MKYSITTAIVTVVGLASPTIASTITFTNNCNFLVYYQHAWHKGEGEKSIALAPNGGKDYEDMKEIIEADGTAIGAAIKFHRGDGLTSGILQFEYTKERDGTMRVPGIYWNFSHVDGARSGVPGPSPFDNSGVMAIPVGTGRGVGSCTDIHCEAGEVCSGSFLFDLDNTKVKVSDPTATAGNQAS